MASVKALVFGGLLLLLSLAVCFAAVATPVNQNVPENMGKAKATKIDITTGYNSEKYTLTNVGNPMHGTASLSSTGKVHYLPVKNYVGQDEFSYTVENSQGQTYSSVVLINVGGSKTSGGGGDPHFEGFDGEQYEVQGAPERWFNLISDTDVLLNAFFHHESYNSKDTTNMVAMALIAHGVRVYVNDTAVLVDGVSYPQLSFGAAPNANEEAASTVEVQGGKVTISKKGLAVIFNVGSYSIEVEYAETEADKPFLDFGVMMLDSSRKPHGLLGQTASHTHSDAVLKAQKTAFHQHTLSNEGAGEIEGVYTDYVVSSAFASDFKYNRFTL